jgi:acetyl-CoA acetyltransferase
MREVAIIGVGLTPWGKFPERSYLDLGVEATTKALDDAGIKWSEVQTMATAIYLWGSLLGTVAGQGLANVMGETGIPITNIYNMCATATSAFRSAYQSVASGECDITLAVGLDKSPKGFYVYPGFEDKEDIDFIRWKMTGLVNPGYWALECRQRMDKYGTTERHLALAKVAVSKHGALNPMARYRKVFTEEEVLNSPMVADPLRLYMICATSDGAAAVVLCSLEKASQYTNKPIVIEAATIASSLYGDGTLRLPTISTPTKGTAPYLSESAESSRMAYEKAGIGPEDIDVLELPDNSSWHYLSYLEILKLCPPGEADRIVETGVSKVGKTVVCSSGGCSSLGESQSAQGLAMICELVWQLRGQAGARQVKNAKVGMAQTYGMYGNSGAVILKV